MKSLNFSLLLSATLALTTACSTVKNPVVVPALIDFNQAACRPNYPRHALRHELQGQTVLEVKFDQFGKIIDVALKTSSGFEILDNAIIEKLKEGHCLAKPGTIDGVPAPSSRRIAYVWKLD